MTAFIGPSGCGKSTSLRTLNRMYSLYPGQRATGDILSRRQKHPRAGVDINMLRAKVGMVFQKPTPFPMSIHDNIAFGVRLYEDLSAREMDERVEWALHQGGDVGRGEGQAEAERNGAFRRPAAAAVHRARRCGQARKSCCWTSRLPRSTRSPTAKIEELITELKEDYTIVIVTHNMQQAARISDFTAYMYLGELIEFGETDQIFLKAAAQGNRGLHHRQVRDQRLGRNPYDRTHTQAVRRRDGADPWRRPRHGRPRREAADARARRPRRRG